MPQRFARLTALLFLVHSHGAVFAQERNENAKLTASDAAAADQFGTVSVSGDTIVVGASFDDCPAGGDCGSAYVFQNNGSSWVQKAKLSASDAAAGEHFGVSIALAGDTVVVGAVFADGNYGAAYVFVRPGAGWSDMTQTAKLTASDSALQDYFGGSVSISGDVIVVGADGDDCATRGDNASCGSAYVFVKPEGGWSDMIQTAKLTASDGSGAMPWGDRFGVSVAISGDTIVAGAYGDNCLDGDLCGSAYVFVKPGGGWSNMTETAKLTASDVADGDLFGRTVSITGDTIVVGAPTDDCSAGDECGSAYVFVKPVGGWGDMTQTAKLTASDAALGDYFGIGASISGVTIVVGAQGDDCIGGFDCGSAYVFIKPAGGWANMTQTAKLTASDAAATDYFGYPVGVSGNTIVVGAGGYDCGAGADCGSAYVFSQILYVDVDANGLNTGMNWTDAYTRLQDALVYASTHPEVNEIWVANGTYKPDQGTGITPGDRTATFQLLDGVALYGGFAGGETALSQRNTAINVATLSGDLNGNDHANLAGIAACYSGSGQAYAPGCAPWDSNTDGDVDAADGGIAENAYHVVTASGTASTAVLDGFTVTAGNADGSVDPDFLGGGILMITGSAAFRRLQVRTNFATKLEMLGFDSIGGGVACEVGGSPSFHDVEFRDNLATKYAGGLHVHGGADVTLVRCRFLRNRSFDTGGGLFVVASNGTVVNSIFEGNVSLAAGGAWHDIATVTYTNCLFSGNSAGSGGAIRLSSADNLITLTNCTLSRNSASSAFCGGLYISPPGQGGPSTLQVRNSILWGNQDSGGTDESAQVLPLSGSVTFHHTLVQGWTGGYSGTGNGGADPLFVDTDGPDNVVGTEDDGLALQAASPAIDAGDSTVLPADAADLDEDLNTAEQIPLDIDGNPRRFDNPFVTDTGVGPPPVVDMGAYEFQANVLYVDAGAAPGGDGSSWAMAYQHLQGALTYASTHSHITEIWVADGTYMPDGGRTPTAGAHVNGSGSRAATFQLLNGVALYGGFAGGETSLSQRNPAINVTTLSGDLSGNDTFVACAQNSPDCNSFGELCGSNRYCIISDNNDENSLHVVDGSNRDSTALIDGFEITSGNANGVDPDPNRFGGGIRVELGSPTIRDCNFVGNFANSGGGALNLGTSTSDISFCRFSGNRSQNQGGAMSISGGNPVIRSCIFDSNTGEYVGAVTFASSSLTVFENCVFANNHSGTAAGAVSFASSIGEFVGCDFFRNEADFTGGAMEIQGNTARLYGCRFGLNRTTALHPGNGTGGAINIINSSLVDVVNCTFAGNVTDDSGGGLHVASGVANVINSTFFANEATTISGGGASAGPGGTLNITNSIFYGNTSAAASTEDDQLAGATLNLTYSDIEGFTGGGMGNTGLDPLFVDADGPDNSAGTFDDDLRLRTGSPAIDAGNTPALDPLGDPGDLDGDGNTTERIPFDLAGNFRAYDDVNTADTGVPGSPVVDMGAYEYFTDCNFNSIPDECDISCAGLAGACAVFAGCGGSSDCNWSGGGANAIPDECDITACDPVMNPSCDDCNLNGIPDACDIAAMPSIDTNPMDGIPDACVVAGDGCNPPSNHWTCGGNWDLGGEDYPDNQDSVQGLVVTMSSVNLFLDEDVEIDGLRLFNGANLDVTQSGAEGDLTIVVPMLAPLEGEPGGEGSERGNIPPPRLIVRGDLIVANGRSVEVQGGAARVGEGGTMELAMSPGDLPEGSFYYPELFLESGGYVGVGGNGVLTITSHFELRDTGFDPLIPGCSGARGNIPPPKFLGTDNSQTLVGGDFSVVESADIVYHSTNSLSLQGDFKNGSRNPICYQWPAGIRLSRDGTMMPAQEFEVGGRDVGPDTAGFYQDGTHTNFSMGLVELVPQAEVAFANGFSNLAGADPCREALYVDRLILGAGSTVILDHARVYYRSLTDLGATVISQGCGQLLHAGCGTCAYYGDIASAPEIQCLIDVSDVLAVIDGMENGPTPPPSSPRSDIAPCSVDAPATSCIDNKDCLNAIYPQCVSGTCGCVADNDCHDLSYPHCTDGRCQCENDAECAGSFTGPWCVNGGCRCAVDDDCAPLGALCNRARDGGRCEIVDVDDVLNEIDAFQNFPNRGLCPPPCPPGACVGNFGSGVECRDGDPNGAFFVGNGMSETDCFLLTEGTGSYCGDFTVCGSPGCP